MTDNESILTYLGGEGGIRGREIQLSFSYFFSVSYIRLLPCPQG